MKIKLWLLTLVLIAPLSLSSVRADTLRVDCVPPTTREDGSALLAPEIASYELITN